MQKEKEKNYNCTDDGIPFVTKGISTALAVGIIGGGSIGQFLCGTSKLGIIIGIVVCVPVGIVWGLYKNKRQNR